MQERTLDNLILENEDYVFDGNLTIKGTVRIQNGSLIVKGKLLFKPNIEDASISIFNGNIIANSIKSFCKIFVSNGNIIIATDADFTHVHCENGDIKVDGSCSAYNVNCRNYLISGYNDSDDIKASEDIYILGINVSGDLVAREIFLADFCEFQPYGPITVTAKHFEYKGPLLNCRELLIS